MINKETKNKFLQDFGNRVRIIRNEKNLTQEELAIKCCSDTRKIGGIERGEYDFRISSILCLCKGLDTKADDLIDLDIINNLKENIFEEN